MRLKARHILKFFGALILVPLILVCLLCVLIYLPPVQRWAINKVGGEMSQTLGMKVSVESVAITPFFDLKAGGLAAVDQDGDTLIHASALQFRVPLQPLFGAQADIKSFELSGTRLHTKSLISDCAIDGVVESLVADVEGVAWERQTVDVRHATLEGADLNVVLTDTAAKDSVSQPVMWKIVARDARINRSHLKILLPADSLQSRLFVDARLAGAHLKRGVFNLGTAVYEAGHVGLDRCDLTLGTFARMKADTIAAVSRFSTAIDSLRCDEKMQVCALLRTLALHEDVYGVDVSDAHGAISLDTLGIRLPDLALLTPNSRIDAVASVDWSALEARGNGRMSLSLQARLGRPDVAEVTKMLVRKGMADAALLRSSAVAPFLRGDIALDADIEGNRQQLHFRNIDLRMARILRLKASGIAYDDAERLQANLTANVAGGQVSARMAADRPREKYSLRGSVAAFPVSRFVPSAPVGPLTCRFDVSGNGFDFTAPQTAFQAALDAEHLDAAGYPLDSLRLSATLSQGKGRALLDVASPIGGVSADVRAIVDSVYNVEATVIGDEIDLQQLANTEKLLKLHTMLSLKGRASKDFNAFEIDGNIVDNYLTSETRSAMFRDISFAASSSSTATTANLSTGDLHFDFQGAGDWRRLSGAVSLFGREMSRQMQNRKFENDTLRHLLPVTSLAFHAGTDNPLSKFLALKGTNLSGIAVQLQTDSANGLHGLATMGTVTTEALQLDTVSCVVTHDDDGLNFLTTFHNFRKSNPHRFTAQLNAHIREEEALASLLFTDEAGRTGIDLALRGELMGDDEGVRFSIRPENPTIAYHSFTVNDDNGVSINRKGMINANVQLVDSMGMGLAIYSVPADETQNDITLSLTSIDLSALCDVLPYMPRLEGVAEGDVHVTEEHGDSLGLSAMATVNVRDLTYEGQRIGNVGAEIIYLPKAGGEHYADAFINFDGKDVGTCSVVYNDRDGHYQGNANLDGFPLEPLNAFLADTGFGLRGFVAGDFALEGTDSKPRLSGTLDLNEAHLYSPVYGIDFLMDERPITFADSRLNFADYLLTSGKTSLKLNGNIDIADLENILLDFDLRATDFEVINSERQKTSLIYGKVLADFNGTARGSLTNLSVRGDIGLLAGTDATYILADSPLTVEDRLSDLVTFTSFEDTTYVPEPEVATTGMSIDMSFGIHIDQGAKFHCLLSRNGESYVDLRGGGDLTLRMTQQGVTRLTGRYTIEEGEMNYELPVIPLKTFQLEQGSYAEFTGDMLNPTLSIRAVEKTRAVVTENDVQRKVNFNVGVEISRTLQDMGLAFTIEAPEDLSVQNELMSMSAEDRNKTAVALLTTGMYVTDNLTSGIKASNALNAFLQSEIQNIAGKALSTIDVSFGLENGTSETGAATTDYSFQFSKRFLDDRISVKIGGSVQSGADAQNSAASFIDNISLEYRLDKSGTRYVRIFYDRAAHDPLEGTMMKTGAGLVLRRKTDRLGELFLFRRRK